MHWNILGRMRGEFDLISKEAVNEKFLRLKYTQNKIPKKIRPYEHLYYDQLNFFGKSKVVLTLLDNDNIHIDFTYPGLAPYKTIEAFL